MHYEWLLFDLDGTLFDYNAAERNALSKAFHKHGFTFNDDYLQTYRDINKKIWIDFENGRITQEEIKSERFRILAEALHIKIDPVRFSTDYLDFLSRDTNLIDGAEEVLKEVSNHYDIVLVTNGLKQVQRPRIGSSTIKDYFKAIVISEEIGYAKPDPRFFDITFEKIGNPPRNKVLLIGDSLTSDITGGTQYNIDTCWFNPLMQESIPGLQINYEIHALPDLIEVLKQNHK